MIELTKHSLYTRISQTVDGGHSLCSEYFDCQSQTCQLSPSPLCLTPGSYYYQVVSSTSQVKHHSPPSLSCLSLIFLICRAWALPGDNSTQGRCPPSSPDLLNAFIPPGVCRDVLLPVHHWGLQVLPAQPEQSPEILLCAPPCSKAGGDAELQGEVRPSSPAEIRDLLEILGHTLQEQLV